MNASRRRLPFLDLKRLVLWKRGQGLVEFAIVIPIVLILMLGTIEFGRLLFIVSAVNSASREGARYGAAVGNFSDCQGITDAARRVSSIAGAPTVAVQYDRPNGTWSPTPTPFATCAPSSPVNSSIIQNGDRVIVSVNSDYHPLVPVPGIPSYFQIHSETVHTIVQDVPIVLTPTPTPTP